MLSVLLIVISAINEGNPGTCPMLHSYLNDAFNENEYGVSIYTQEGENITDSFLKENRELYKKGDMDKIVNSNYDLIKTNYPPDNE